MDNEAIEAAFSKLKNHVIEREDKGPSIWFSPRDLLHMIGGSRRTWSNMSKIESMLNKHDLETLPAFNSIGIDDDCYIVRRGQSVQPDNLGMLGLTEEDFANISEDDTPTPSDTSSRLETSTPLQDFVVQDPVHRVSVIFPKRELVTIHRDKTISEAVTLMLFHNFSQLPVIQGQKFLGLISWKSIGRIRLFKSDISTVLECLDTDCQNVTEDEMLLSVVHKIMQSDVVVVLAKNGSISNLITASDVTEIFGKLSKPFLLVEYIEKNIRSILAKIPIDELRAAKDAGDQKREILSISDLTFGEYVRILENPKFWDKLGLTLDRAIIRAWLEDVRKIRNDLMHFNSDGLEVRQMELLNKVFRFFQQVSKHSRRQEVKKNV